MAAVPVCAPQLQVQQLCDHERRSRHRHRGQSTHDRHHPRHHTRGWGYPQMFRGGASNLLLPQEE